MMDELRAALLVVIIILQGCSTIQTKIGNSSSSGFGHPYSGVKENAKSWKSLGDGYMIILATPFGILLPVVFTYLVIDFGGSVVGDTVLLPVDLVAGRPMGNGSESDARQSVERL